MTRAGTGVYIALGSNLPATGYGSPRESLDAALGLLARESVAVVRRSSWWRSEPQPASDQPDFINGVVEVDTSAEPAALMTILHGIEADFGRVRRQRWEARTLDLDLIDFRGRILTAGDEGGLILPHPRATERLFVLLPLREIAPDWRDPVSGKAIDSIVSSLKYININKL